jgi:hypothetical protein
MNLSVDASIAHIRREPIFLEGRFPMLMPAQARLFQLQEGQVIQAVVKQNELGLHLSWDQSSLPLPASWLSDV